MSTFSDQMAAVSLGLLTQFGEAVTFTRTTEGAYNPATAATGSSSDSTFTGFSVPIDYDNNELDGSLIQQGDVRLFVNATSTPPDVGDQVALDSVNYRVLSVRKYAINSDNVLYELQVRI